MTKDKYGVWEITVPPQDGKCAIPHDSKIKVRVSQCASILSHLTYLTHLTCHDRSP